MSEWVFEQNKHGIKTRMCVRRLQNSWPKLLRYVGWAICDCVPWIFKNWVWVWPCAPFNQWDIVQQKQRLMHWGLLSFCSMEPFNYHHVYEPRLTCQMMGEKWSSRQLTLHQPRDMGMRPSSPSRANKDKSARSAQRMVRNNFKPLYFGGFCLFTEAKELIQIHHKLSTKIICFYSQTDFYHTVWQTLYHHHRATTLEKWHDLLTQYIIPHGLQNFQATNMDTQMKMEDKRTGYPDPRLLSCVCVYLCEGNKGGRFLL